MKDLLKESIEREFNKDSNKIKEKVPCYIFAKFRDQESLLNFKEMLEPHISNEYEVHQNFLCILCEDWDTANSLNNKLSSILHNFNSKILDMDYDPYWYEDYLKIENFGILSHGVLKHASNKVELKKKINENILDTDRDDFLAARAKLDQAVMSYTETQWIEEHLFFISNNWDCTDLPASEFVSLINNAVGNIAEDLNFVYRFANNNIVNAIKRKGSAIGQNNPDEVRSLLALRESMEAFSPYEDAKKDQSNDLWNKIVDIIIAELKEDYPNIKTFLPNNYETAKNKWYLDESLSDLLPLITPFKSLLDLSHEREINPEERIALGNVVYLDCEQSIDPLNQLVGFVVAHKMKIMEVKQTKLIENALTEYTKVMDHKRLNSDVVSDILEKTKPYPLKTKSDMKTKLKII